MGAKPITLSTPCHPLISSPDALCSLCPFQPCVYSPHFWSKEADLDLLLHNVPATFAALSLSLASSLKVLQRWFLRHFGFLGLLLCLLVSSLSLLEELILAFQNGELLHLLLDLLLGFCGLLIEGHQGVLSSCELLTGLCDLLGFSFCELFFFLLSLSCVATFFAASVSTRELSCLRSSFLLGLHDILATDLEALTGVLNCVETPTGCALSHCCLLLG